MMPATANIESKSRERFVLIDALRGFAALGVLVYHFDGRLQLPSVFGTAAQLGGLGVALFFVISGFVITASVGASRVTGPFVARFALRRSVRLDLPYFASIAVLLAIGAFGARFGANQHLPTPAEFVAHLFYLQDILGMRPLSPVYWTLCLELQFYLFLVLGLWVLQRLRAPAGPGRTPAHVGAAIGSIVVSLVCSELGIGRGSFIPMWYCFALGMVTYWSVAGWTSVRYAALCIAIVFAYGAWVSDVWAVATALSALVVLVAGYFRRLNALGGVVPQFFGRTSYSLYLTHNIFGWYALSFALRYTNPWIAAPIGFAAAVGSAWLWYLLIERPSINLSRKVRMGAGA